jgi:site-specific DNA-methyltransferase (adenine-specific)
MPIKPCYGNNGVTIHNGDCRIVLPSLTADSFDACITDPPYGLKFMGKTWDHGVPNAAVWAEVLRVMKPGAFLLAFGGTRTHHRLMCAIEDAGFEIRDCMMLFWCYGSGFPKSLDISKALDRDAGAEREVIGIDNSRNRFDGARRLPAKGSTDYGSITSRGMAATTLPATEAARAWTGFGTSLKPSYEPIIVAMKPLDGTFAENALKHGVAGLNIDGCRINPGTVVRGGGNGIANNGGRFGAHQYSGERPLVKPHELGRWPANVLLDEGAAEVLDAQSGDLTSGANPTRRFGPKTRNAYGTFEGGECIAYRGAETGGASRFFYTSKADSDERGTGNDHPTVKPLDLMRWLSKLVCPPSGGALLDPFMGSGSTLLAGRSFFQQITGIDIEERYCGIAAKRLQQEVFEFA